jgi:hypothetical protein
LVTLTQKSPEVRIRFSVTGDDGRVYSDALIFTEAEYAALTEEQIEAQMQARYDAWAARIAEAEAQSEKSEAEQDADTLAKLKAERDAMDATIVEIETKLAPKESVKGG